MATTPKTLMDFLKTKINPFLRKNPHVSKETITDFIDNGFDDIVYASVIAKYNTVVVTKKELVATLLENGIDKEFINKHLETLLKLEALRFIGTPISGARRFVNDCVDLMYKWYKQSQGEGNPFYTEVRHDYHDDEAGCWTIDAWRTPDDDEDGVAPIEVYDDGHLAIRDENSFGFAICDFIIIEAIEETLKEIELERKGK
jgi:hypothetical protein